MWLADSNLCASAPLMRMADGHRMFIFRSFWICWNLAPIFPGFAYASQRALWDEPLFLIQIYYLEFHLIAFPAKEPGFSETLAARQSLLGKNLRHLLPASTENLCVVGCNISTMNGARVSRCVQQRAARRAQPSRVVKAAQEQLATAQYQQRYLHDNVNRYADV